MNGVLEPCPWCGWETDIYGNHSWNAESTYSVYCLGCGKKTKEYETKKEAIEAWNDMCLRHRNAVNDQSIKADAGKRQIHFVPPQIIYDVAEVREYGVKKYGASESWREVEVTRYIDALGRHFCEFLKDPLSKDAESRIEHYKHMACNLAFLCEMLKLPF